MSSTEIGRSARKRQVITDAAREVFLRNGYRDTTMDVIAATAGVSKQTVYKHFADKERLFRAIIEGSIDEAGRSTQPMLDALRESDDVPGDLRAFARQQVKDVLQPHIVQLRRHVIANAERFPELARTWYERAPEDTHRAFAALFERLTERGELTVADPQLAAEQFNALVLFVPLNRAMLVAGKLSTAKLHRYADDGVRVFLAAYGPDAG